MASKPTQRPLLLGAHVSASGGFCKALDRAEGLGCTAMQVFVGNPRAWRSLHPNPTDLKTFLKRRETSPVRAVIVHAIYLPNLASPDAALRKRSISCVVHEIGIADALHAEAYVIHMGSAKGDPPSKAVPRVAKAVDEILAKAKPRSGCRIALETTAGKGFSEKGTLHDIFEVMRRLKRGFSAGICLDTAHLLAAGVDFRKPSGAKQVLAQLRSNLAPGQLLAVHVNDSKGECGSHLDRHEHLGKGKIGKKGFAPLLTSPAIRNLPMILETPKKEENDDKRNLRILRSIISGRR